MMNVFWNYTAVMAAQHWVYKMYQVVHFEMVKMVNLCYVYFIIIKKQEQGELPDRFSG